MGITVRTIEDDAGYEAAARLSNRSFAEPFSPERFNDQLPLLRTGHFVLVEHDSEIAGTGGAWPFRLTVPGGVAAPVWGLTWIGVDAGHRRSGILTAMVASLTAGARDAGAVATALYASESGIYGRFGYAIATEPFSARLPTTRSGFRPGWPRSDGRIRTLDLSRELADRGSRIAALRSVYDRAVTRRPGEVQRFAEHWDLMFSRHGGWEGADRILHLLHEARDGKPDGYAMYSVDEHWTASGPEHTLRTRELMAVDPAVELELWRALFDHDLVGTVTALVPIDWVVREALADPWAVSFKSTAANLWVRLLDVPAAFSGRRYPGPGAVTVTVTGAEDLAGTYRIAADADGTGGCDRTDAAADLEVAIADLSAAWLGRPGFARAGRAGRVIERTTGAAARADALLRWDPEPFSTHHF